MSATTIVVPTAAVAPQFGAIGGLIGSLSAAGASAAVSTVASVTSETDLTNLNAADIAAIFNALPAADQVLFAKAVVDATNSGRVSTATTGVTRTNDSDIRLGGNVFQPAVSTNLESNPNGTSSAARSQSVFNVLNQVASLTRRSSKIW